VDFKTINLGEESDIQLKTMKLSDQALGALMMALQKSLLEQSDITELLKNFEFIPAEDGLWVKNPPVVKFGYADEEE
jgi:hypothetical protein